jgi:putative transcriptional regulator
MEATMTTLGKRLIGAAKEARAIARGEADAKSYVIHVPPDIDVKRLRRQFGLSQGEFANRFGFTPARIRDWEQGRSSPDGAVRAYLIVIAREPEAVQRALAPAPVRRRPHAHA